MVTMYSLLLLLVGTVAISANQITRFCGIGYNLLTANPDAMNDGGVDPGYLPTRKIFVVDNTDHPSQLELVERDSCVTHSSVSMIYDEQSYQRKFDNRVEVEIGVDAMLLSARFGLSTGFQEAKKEVTTSQQIRMDNETVCNYGRGRLKMALAPFGALQVTDEFAAALCALPENFSNDPYMHFLDRWGTHVTIQTDVGVRDIHKKTSSKASFFQEVTSQTNIASSVSGSYKVVDNSIEINMNTMKLDQTFQENFGEHEVRRTVGSKNLPEPIAVKLMTLDQVLQPNYWSKSLSTPVCPGDITGKLSTFRDNIAMALRGYASYKGVAIGNSTGILKMELTWPTGTYGLFKPQTGCPHDWKQGFRYFDSEDKNNINSYQNIHYLSGQFDQNIRLEFCMKINTRESSLDMDWPVGSYCILKYRPCPRGLSEGFIYWDDEDHDNDNKVGGYYPDGEYGRNTNMKFCCRSDGNPTTPIVLPTKQPFVLIQASRYGCQQVVNMRTTPMTILFDTEDDRNDDSFGGNHPYNPGDRNVRLSLCHYST